MRCMTNMVVIVMMIVKGVASTATCVSTLMISIATVLAQNGYPLAIQYHF